MPLSDAYFDLDKSDIRADAQSSLQKDADWLKKWTSTRINLEGHCDERGSAAYNLALGSRRAQAVKDYLVNLGVAGEPRSMSSARARSRLSARTTTTRAGSRIDAGTS